MNWMPLPLPRNFLPLNSHSFIYPSICIIPPPFPYDPTTFFSVLSLYGYDYDPSLFSFLRLR